MTTSHGGILDSVLNISNAAFVWWYLSISRLMSNDNAVWSTGMFNHSFWNSNRYEVIISDDSRRWLIGFHLILLNASSARCGAFARRVAVGEEKRNHGSRLIRNWSEEIREPIREASTRLGNPRTALSPFTRRDYLWSAPKNHCFIVVIPFINIIN